MNGYPPGAGQVGTALIGVFFAVIGAAAGSLSCLAGAGVLAAFLSVMVAVHWVGGGGVCWLAG